MGAPALLALPSLYIISIWLLYLNPTEIVPKIPTLPFIAKGVSVDSLLPLYPTSLFDSFVLGKLEGELSFYDGKTDPISKKAVEGLLNTAATAFNRPTLTRQEISKLEAQIKEYEQERGVVQRVKGLFTFINLVWFLSICGICVAVIPVIAILARPLVSILVHVFTDVIVPLLIALKPVYELLAYIICFLFVANGLKTNPDTGFFISLTGALLFLPSFMYSTMLHASGGGDKEAFAQLLNFVSAAQFIPIAIMHQSTFLGFLSVFALYGMLGFSVVCTGLCYYIGFNKDEAMPRVMVTSTFFVFALTIVKVLNIPAKFLLPFTTGLMTMGSATYFLACLILSSYYYSRRGSIYFQMQVLTIASLMIALFLGSVFSISPLFNTACTYAVLYAMEKTVELGNQAHMNIWFFVLGGSISLYLVSLFLHNHPGFVVSMIDGEWVV